MIIDCCCDIPTKEGIKNLLLLPPQMKGYIEVFGNRIATFLGIEDEYNKIKENSPFDEVLDFVIQKAQSFAMTPSEFISVLNNNDVEKCLFLNEDHETNTGYKGISNDYMANLVYEAPDRFLAFAAADPHKGTRGLKELERAITDLGLHGYGFSPFMDNLYSNDRKLYPFYSKCEELNVPVWIHTSINYSRTRKMDFGRPLYLDEVAIDFPDLKIIAGHGGWPWVLELIGIARRHPNIYIEIGAQRPKYMSYPGSGWESLLQFGNTLLQNQVLFGSAWLTMGMPIGEVADEVKQLPLKESVKEKWLYFNAKKLFKL
jgi:predicted TIM-barrel fold metal-dependent hydrolase